MASVVCIVVRTSPIFRAGLTSVLAKGPFKPVWSEPSSKDASSKLLGERALVLMGVRESGTLLAALGAAKARFPDAPAVVIGDSAKRELITTALTSGAASFIDENVAASTLVKELELIAEGESVISVFIVRRLLGHAAAPASYEAAPPIMVGQRQAPHSEEAEPGEQLSTREAAILNALVQGAPNKVIASGLNITESTVKVHIKAILRKIKARNRTQAAIWALHRRGLQKPLHAENGEAASIANEERRPIGSEARHAPVPSTLAG